MTTNPADFRRDCLRWKLEFLESYGAAGGTRHAFIEHVVKDYGAECEKHGLSMTMEAIVAVWNSSAGDAFDDAQLELGGFALPVMLTTRGDDGHHRKKLARFANLHDLRVHAEIRIDNAARLRDSANHLRELYEVGLERAGGDESALLREVLDA